MGLLNSALHVGSSAILTYQNALQLVGNNISNAGNEDYTRVTPDLAALQGQALQGDLHPGAGVAMSGIQRNIDEALEGRVRLAIGAQESVTEQRGALSRVESLFNQLGGTDVASRLADFFSNFDEVRNLPEDSAVRDLALTSARQLAESLRSTRSELVQLASDFDEGISDLVTSANSLAEKVAELNEEITRVEAGNGQATALRDQRDGLLRELGRLFDVTVREQPNGAINVYVGSEALVQGRSVRELIAVPRTDGETTRTAVRFADTNADVDIRGGRLAGLIAARDTHALGRIAALDELARAVIGEVNAIHADGQGLTGYRAVTGSFDVLATNAALDSTAAGLNFPPTSGSFYVTVLDDATSTPASYRIDVQLEGNDTDTTLESLVDSINTEVDGVTASITPDRRLRLVADQDRSFVFGFDGSTARADTSGVLAALGVNTLFTGSDATNIGVNASLLEDPRRLGSASAFLPGDGTTAGRIAALDTTASQRLSGQTLLEYYNAVANDVAVSSAAAQDAQDATGTVLNSLQSQRESISGVNLDEEAIALVKYQRAFQGASRFVSVVDQLISELVSLIR
ncbi:MAG: flagellar hook-associated protein FlgK [Phycisphaerae bacterium]|nr:flagellar hook-associated protein FlgK [Phycisphaerae bacterium]